MSSAIKAIHIPDTAKGKSAVLKVVNFRSRLLPLVMRPKPSYWSTARIISAKPKVAMVRSSPFKLRTGKHLRQAKKAAAKPAKRITTKVGNVH